jgi:hypothetical protein
MCVLCTESTGDQVMTKRTQILQLLALIEHPDALPPDAVLRLGREIMGLVRAEPELRQCEAVTSPKPHAAKSRREETTHASRRS